MTDALTVRIGDECRTGRAVDCSGRSLDPERVVSAVRGVTADRSAPATALSVTCPDPGPVHDHVGLLTPSVTPRTRTALATAARSRGVETPVDDDLASVRAALADAEVPAAPDLERARRRLAGTESAVDECRERVATLRGRLQARREEGRDTSGLEGELAEATAALSEHETERAAAREALAMARREARASRDARERRRKLEDRLANLERTARDHLVAAVRDRYAAAVAAAPGDSRASGDGSLADADPFAADDVTAALAVARVADLRAPVVLACDRFADPADAAAWLDAPVIRVPCPA